MIVPVTGTGAPGDPRRPDLPDGSRYRIVADDGDTMTVEVDSPEVAWLLSEFRYRTSLGTFAAVLTVAEEIVAHHDDLAGKDPETCAEVVADAAALAAHVGDLFDQ